MAKYCTKCGKELDDKALYCTKCGATQNAAQKQEYSTRGIHPLAAAGGVLAILVLAAAIFLFVKNNSSIKPDQSKAEELESVPEESETMAETIETETETDREAKEKAAGENVSGENVSGEEASSGQVTAAEETQTEENDEEEVETVNYYDVMEKLKSSAFYGVWCSASDDINEALKISQNLQAKGFSSTVLLTSEWENLNTADFYAVSAGVFNREDLADEALSSVQKYYPDAYVKYTGEYLGEVVSTEWKQFVIRDSDKRTVTMSELDGLSSSLCRYARNEIYARHGRMFDSEDLRAYFESKSWYQGTIPAGSFSNQMLNEIELANIVIIQKYEQEQGYR